MHTDVGHTCVGAIVNGTMVPLDTPLETGDVVEIKTRKGSGPSEDWLKFVKTNQAKNKIKAYLTRKETEKKEERIDEGEKLLKDELVRRGFDPKEYMDKKRLENIFHEFRVSNYTDFMYGLAVKSINPTSVCEKLTNQKGRVSEDEALQHVLNREVVHKGVSANGLIIPGIDSMKMSIAHCCMPVYGDEVVGYITKGEGVKVHRRDCPNIKAARGRLIDVYWDEGNPDRTYECDVILEAKDRNFLLTDIVNVVSQCRVTMETVNASVNHESLTSVIKMTLRVRDLDQLTNVMANMCKVDSVLFVERETH